MAEIQIQYADGRLKTTPFRPPEMVIGRDADCDFVLDDPLASRRHARLYEDRNGAIWVEDRESKNGTLLNDRPLDQSTRLKHGDRIGIGRCRLVLRMEEATSVVLDEPPTRDGTESVWSPSQQLSLSKQRLETLYELYERLSGLFERDDLLAEIVQACMESLHLERAGLALWSGESAAPRWVIVKNLRPSPDGEVRISRTLVERALQNEERSLINDPVRDMPVPTESMIHNNICSAMVVPLVYHGKVHGVLYGDRTSSSRGYGKEDIDFFAALGRLAAMGLVNTQLLEEKQQRQRMEAQLQLARQIQNRLFPAGPIERDNVTVQAYNDPGRLVSGDYFDYFERPDGQITIVIADVSGKGVAAALLMANLQAAVHVTLTEERDLSKAVDRLNRLICDNVDSDRFITGVIGLLDPQSRVVRYVNTGHPPVYPVQPDGTVSPLLHSLCPPRGVDRDAEIKVEQHAMGPGSSTLIFYTDGVLEAQNDKDEFFGDRRLGDLLKTTADLPPSELLTRIRRSLQQFIRHAEQFDDITVVAARMT
ncbi:MAG: SpoIIE family protein phosphatase [Phycisphaerae bacterium]